MSVAFILDFEGGSAAEYDQVVERMQLGGRMAPGGRYHGAGATPSGLRVLDVWDDDGAFEEFARTKIGPISAAVGLSPPVIQRLEIAQIRDGSEPDAEAGFAQVVRLEADGATFRAFDDAVLPDGQMPAGSVFHVNGPLDGGWCVIDYWTSREARDRFVETRLRPAMESAEGMAPPAIEDLELHATMTTAPAGVGS